MLSFPHPVEEEYAVASKKTPTEKSPVTKVSATKAPSLVTGTLAFKPFGFDLAKIRRYWKKIPTSQEAQAYLKWCQTTIKHMDTAELHPIVERNSAAFKKQCRVRADEGFHPERVLTGYRPLPIQSEHIRACLLFEIEGQLEELEADTKAGKKELTAFRKLNWLGEMDELKAVFHYLRQHGLIEVKRDFNVMICDLCLYRGHEISIKSLGSAIKYTEAGSTSAQRQSELDSLLGITEGRSSD
jgi:hypothetical protein